MRYQLLLIPAALVASAPALSAFYMTLEEAQGLMFPGVALKPHDVTLTEGQARAIAAQAQAPVHRHQVKAWLAANGGWFILDQVHGKDDWVTYAVSLSPEGAVQSIEIIECLQDYSAVRMPAWRAQFVGQVPGEKRYIENISGSTLSTRHIAEGVRRVLATYALVLKPRTL
jgi:hypothetical protein